MALRTICSLKQLLLLVVKIMTFHWSDWIAVI